MRKSFYLLPKFSYLLVGIALAASHPLPLSAQDGAVGADQAVIPTNYSAGSFFNRQLGTALRFSYHTKGYGTEDGVASLGGMKVFNFDGATATIDAQGTMSDDFGGGFNVGAYYRQLTTTGMSFDSQRILGAGFWTDGQSTASDNFFTALGFSLESLGESFDVRLNGSFPLERHKTGDATLLGSGTPFYSENRLFGALEGFTVDTAYSVVDGELAKRIDNFEAWAFVGGYQLDAGGEDATGYRAGVRGYAVPDLALSLQVTDDDIYATNVMFGITWFVGRTTTANQPGGTILDRFREPVIRNDFIPITSQQFAQVSGNALTDAATGDEFHVVHVNSEADPGGDGTIENPFNMLEDADGAGSQENSIILVHAGSMLTPGEAFTFQNGQEVFGEGGDIEHLVDTNEMGVIALPETDPDAGTLSGTVPFIDGTNLAEIFSVPMDVENTEVNNFTIENGMTVVNASQAGNIELGNLDIDNPTGDALVFEDMIGSVLMENTVTVTGAGGNAILLDGGDQGANIGATIENSAGGALAVQNKTGGTVNYTGQLTDTGGTGILLDMNADTTINLTNATTEADNGIDIQTSGMGNNAITITDNTDTAINFSGTVGLTASDDANGLFVDGNDEDTTIGFVDLDATAVDGNTVDINDGGTVTIGSADDTRLIANTGTGDAVEIEGDMAVTDNNAAVTINSDVLNTGGGMAVDIQNRGANAIAFNGTVDANSGGGGISVVDSTGGTVDFNERVTLDTGAQNGVTLTDNDGATINIDELDATAGDGNTVEIAGGGTITIGDANNDGQITNDGNGNALQITGNGNGDATVTVDPDITNMVAGNAVLIQNRDENDVTINGAVEDTGEGIVINNNTSEGSILFTDTITATTAASNAVTLTNNTDVTVSFNGLDLETTSGTGFTATGGGILAATGDNNIETQTGSALVLNDMTIDIAGVTFSEINKNGLSDNDGIDLVNLDGEGIVALGSGDDPGDGGTINMNGVGNDNFGINVDNVDNLVVNNITVGGAQDAVGVNVTNQMTDSTAAFNGLVVNTRDGHGVNVHDNEDGEVMFNQLTTETIGAGNALNVVDNDDGTYIFTELDATTSGAGGAVFVNNNDTSTVSIDGMEVSATGSGDAFTAMGSGTLAVTGDTSVSSNTGQGVVLDGIEIDSTAGAEFETVTVTGSSASGIVLRDVEGGRFRAGRGGNSSLTTSDAAISVDNVVDAIFDDMVVDNTAGAGNGSGIEVTNMDAGDAVVFNNSEINTFNETAVLGISNEGGTINFNGLVADSTAGSGDGVVLQNNTGGTFDFNSTEVETTDGDGVRLSNNTGATMDFNHLDITTQSGSGFEATGGGTLIATGNNHVDVQAGAVTGAGLNLNGVTANASGITFNSVSVDGTQNGIVVNGVTGGAVTVGSTGTASIIDNTVDDAIDVVNSENVTIENVDVTGAGGNGLTATHTNASAYGLTVNDLTVDSTSAGGIVTNHSDNGNFTMSVNESIVDVASDFDHTGDGDYAVSIIDSEFNDTTDFTHNGNGDYNLVVDESDFDDAVTFNGTGSGDVDITFDDSSVNTTGTDVAFTLSLDNAVTNADVRIRRNTIAAEDAVAFDLDMNSNIAKTVDFMFSNNNVSNNSADATAEFDAFGPTVFNSTVLSNNFSNAGAGDEFVMAANDNNTVVNLNLKTNIAMGGAGEFVLRKSGTSTFGIQDRDDVETDNSGNFNYDSAGNVLTDFDDINSVPVPSP